MTDQQALFTSLLCSGHFPPISDDVLDNIEDFLIYSVNADINIHIDILMQYYAENFNFFMSENNNLSERDFHLQYRLLHTMRYIRPSFLSTEFSTQLENYAFFYLNNSSQEMIREAFIVLVDHFISRQHGAQKRIIELVKFIMNFLNRASQMIQEIDHQLLFNIIYSFRYLLSVADQSLIESVLPTTIGIFTKIIYNALQLKDSPNFFPTFELIVAKSLRLVALFTEWFKKIPNDSFSLILEIQKNIPDDVRFVHIYQNFMVLACSIIELKQPIHSESSIETVMSQIMNISPLFVHPPFNKSRRAIIFFHAMKNWIIYRDKTQPSIFLSIISKTMPVFGHLQGQIPFLRCTFEIYQAFITPELFENSPYLQVDLLEQFIVALEMTRDEFDSYDLEAPTRPFDIEYFLESNIILTKLIGLVIITKDMGEKPLSGVTDLLIRFINYFSFFLDLAGRCGNSHAPNQIFTNFVHSQITLTNFKKRVNEHISLFIQLLTRLPAKLLNYIINGHLIMLLPSKPYHNHHIMLILQLVRTLKSPTIFYVSYFHCIVKHFDYLFLREQNNGILYTTKNVFQEAFEKSQDQSMASQLCHSFYAFLMLSIASKNKYMIELAFDLLQHIRGAKDPKDVKPAKLATFCQLMKQSQFSYHIILRSISDDPNLEIIVSVLAVYLFPLLNIQADQIDAWISLFLPALESDTHRLFACQPLLEWRLSLCIPNLRESTQYRLITALSKEPKCVKVILSKIPEITARHANTVVLPPERRFLIKYTDSKNNNSNLNNDNSNNDKDGYELPYNAILNSIELETNPTDEQLEALTSCFIKLVGKLQFIESIVNPEIVRTCKFLIKHKKELLEHAHERVEIPAKYSLLVLREQYELTIDDYSQYVEKLDDFLNYITLLCYKPSTVKTALVMIDKILPKVPVSFIFLRVATSLLHSSIYEHKTVNRIFEKHLFARQFKIEDELIVKAMCQAFYGATRISTKHFRLLALKALDFFQPNYVEENRKNIIKDMGRFQANVPYRRFDLIFMRPFDDVPDPIGTITKLISTLGTIHISSITPEVQRLLKTAFLNDKFLIPIETAKFILKIIIKMLPYLPFNKNMVQIYDQLVATLRDEKSKPLIPYFFTKIKKYFKISLSNGSAKGYPSINGSIPSLFNTSRPLVTPSVEDLQFLHFFVKYTSPQFSVCAQWLISAIRLIQQNVHTMSAETLQNSITYILRITRRIRLNDQKLDLTSLFTVIFEFFTFSRYSLLPISIPLYKLPLADPLLTLQVITTSLKSNWSTDVIYIASEMIAIKKCSIFRQMCFKEILGNLKLIFKFLTSDSLRKDLDFIILRTISTLSNIVENLDGEDFDLHAALHLAKYVFRSIEMMNKGFKPSFIYGFTSIFFPIRHIKTIETRLFQTYLNEIIPLFMIYPFLFYHPLFLRKFSNFMKQLSPEYRNQIWKELPSKATDKIFSKTLANQMMNELYSTFPPHEKTTIRIGFKDYPTNKFFLAYALNYSAAMIGAHSNVIIEDLCDSPIKFTNAQVHALWIRQKHLDLGSVKTITRFSHISKFLSSFNDYSDEDLEIHLSKLLSRHPFMFKQSLLCFRLLGQKNFIVKTPSRSLLQFIFGLSAATLENINRLPERQFIGCLPLVFMTLHKIGVMSVASRVIDLLVFTTILVLKKLPNSISVAQIIPYTIELYISSISFQDINQNRFSELRSLLEERKEKTGPEDQARMRFVYQLIPPLSNILYANKFIPNDLLPSVFFAANFPKEIMSLYQKALQSSYAAGGFHLAKKILENTHETLKVKNLALSEPTNSIFATIAEWIKQSGSDQDTSNFVHLLMDSFKPITENKAYSEFSNLKQPVHDDVIKCIESLESELNIIQVLKKKYPQLKILDTPTYENNFDGLLDAAFRIDWFSIHPSVHKSIFLKMLLPQVFHKQIYKMKEIEKDDIIVSVSQSLPNEFRRFIEYYVYSFPDSSLSTSLSQTFTFSHAPPLISHSLYQNMHFLECSNDWNDSLGLLTREHPSLLTATSFHQISNFAAARAHYLRTMGEDSNSYFHALMKLRTIVLNLTLASTSNLRDTILGVKKETQTPLITLPIFQDTSPHFEFKTAMSEITPGKYSTSFLSPTYIPMYFKSSMIEECQQIIYVYLHHQVNVNDLLRLSTIQWTSSLDKGVAMISNLAWRFSMLEDFVKNSSTIDSTLLQHLPKLNEAIKVNHEIAAKLLSRAGSFYHALHELEYSDSNNDLINSPPTSLQRISRFLAKKSNSYTALRLSAILTLRDITNSARMMNQMTRRQSLNLLMTLQHYFPEYVYREQFIPRLFQELQQPDIVDRNIIIAMIVSLVKQDEKLRQVFSQRLGQLKEDERELWMAWLPVVFQVCKTVPIDFMMSLLSYNTSYFLLQLHHLKNSRMIHDKDYFNEMNNEMKNKKEVISEFEGSLEFIKRCEPDIQQMIRSIRAIRLFYFALIKGRSVPEYPEETKTLYSNFEELTNYIDSHPPIFDSHLRQTNYTSLTGFRFPTMNQNVMRVSIESKSPNEAHLHYTTIRGESRTCLLVSPIVYRYTPNEYIFTYILQKMIDRRREEYSLIYYPQAFLIHPMLLLVNSPAASNMSNICAPHSIPKMLFKYSDISKEQMVSPKEQLVSPKEAVDRRKATIPDDLLFKWFIKGAQGNKNDFIYMRKSFATHFATISYLHSLFGTPQMINPPLLFYEDRQRIWFPGFMDKTITYASIAMTNQINGLLPEFVMRGSFATSWNTLATVIVSNQDRIRTCLSAIAPELSEDEKQLSRLSERIKGFGSQIGEDTDKSDEYFPFLYLDHLIKTSKNSLLAQPTKFGWV
ncbi:hypothetical protein TRFO_22664 [Tritrichomonas foetus]|uniref:Uncharacterized protein n=1 Tax=Tritrichomonas foetus TaxID=1144522 RepID=A0A1J4KHD4_9EUKA|nr:hypothetical protein TRFO_22664 [Tritrichomonas foetus]|eukprot:OHT08749.1 hypothetical protein TRFO_22664 [Tritrichomonas foetus]